MLIQYDFHIHSALSPCADNEMTPNNIVNMAKLLGFDAIAVTDHNACGNCRAAMCVGRQVGLTVIPGMELCTSEEIHVVCLFPDADHAEAFAAAVAEKLPPIENRPDIFGDQLLIDEQDEVVGTEAQILSTASFISIDEVPALTKQYGGIAMPAHIDRPSYSLLSALGDIPPLPFSCYEVSFAGDPDALEKHHPALSGKQILRDSDAHALEMMREPSHTIEAAENTPAAIIEALTR